jgi:hypothetical protein
MVPSPFAGGSRQTPRHPMIMLLGPIDLHGTTGQPPTRARIQCIEYCTWLLTHPASAAHTMTTSLAIADTTRRSNLSRLRTWLGHDDRGHPYLPDAYTGRINLSPLVSSDWHQLQLLTATDIQHTSTPTLHTALNLIRGAPLADTTPGQWHWAEEIRTEMIKMIRDIGIELTNRALAHSNIDLARWAAARALTATPDDEFLISARIRTEHQAGNPAEVERLHLQLAAHSRTLGVQLHPDTVRLLQHLIQRRPRVRA